MTAEQPRPCPACGKPRDHVGHYLCVVCWYTLPRAARGPLLRRDGKATLRLIELNRQINDGVPLSEVVITTR